MNANRPLSSVPNAQFILYVSFSVIALIVAFSTILFTTKRVTDKKSVSTTTQAAATPEVYSPTTSYKDPHGFTLTYPTQLDLLPASDYLLKLKNTGEPAEIDVIMFKASGFLRKQKLTEIESRINLFCNDFIEANDKACKIDTLSVTPITNQQGVKGYQGTFKYYSSQNAQSETYPFYYFSLDNPNENTLVLVTKNKALVNDLSDVAQQLTLEQ